MGYGYPIDNTQRLEKAIHVWKKSQKRLKHFKRNAIMSKTKPKYKPNILYKNAGWCKRHRSQFPY